MKYLHAFVTFVIFSLSGMAQEDKPEMMDALRADGKIWVVVAVAAVILAGLLFFMAYLDRKIAKLEKERKEK